MKVEGFTEAEIKKLPKELRDELRPDGNRGFRKDQIIRLMRDFGQGIKIDQLLILIYNDSGEALKRNFLHSTLHNLIKSKHVSTVKKSGVYRLVTENESQ